MWQLLDQIQTIARNGLHYATNSYDRERYERLLELATQAYGLALELPPAEVRQRLIAELGHITPKLGANAAIFDAEGRILLVKRSLIYLHGFASGPASSKGQWLKQRLAQLGIELRIPDLNVPAFATLTLSKMIERARREVEACPAGPVGIIGSSMGGMVALQLVACYGQREVRAVDKLLLLAPAFDFIANRRQEMGAEGLERWRQSDRATFYHYQVRKSRLLHYGIIEDLAQYDAFTTQISLPVQIIHGWRDASVPAEQSQRLAASRPNVQLELVDSDHALLDQLELIWAHTLAWFGLA